MISAFKITKWLAGQRTTVGKLLYKPKSGSKAKLLTARQKWQLANFGLLELKDYIRPRTHTHDTGEVGNAITIRFASNCSFQITIFRYVT